MCLNVDSAEPLHAQLKEKLKKDILNEVYTEKIPSERELMRRYSVSRNTVRAAVAELVHLGILKKTHGKGTFISKAPIQDWLGSFESFTKIIQNTGMTPGSKLLFKGKVEAPKNVREKMNSDNLFLIERLRYADDEPVAIEKHYFKEEVGKQLAHFDLENVTIYDVLEKKIGLTLFKANQNISSSNPSEDDAFELEIPTTHSVLVSERIIYDPDDIPLECLISVFRSDRYSFNIEMKRNIEI